MKVESRNKSNDEPESQADPAYDIVRSIDTIWHTQTIGCDDEQEIMPDVDVRLLVKALKEISVITSASLPGLQRRLKKVGG